MNGHLSIKLCVIAQPGQRQIQNFVSINPYPGLEFQLAPHAKIRDILVYSAFDVSFGKQ